MLLFSKDSIRDGWETVCPLCNHHLWGHMEETDMPNTYVTFACVMYTEIESSRTSTCNCVYYIDCISEEDVRCAVYSIQF